MSDNIYLNCSYIPAELFVAAGLRPVRLWPSSNNSEGKILLPEDYCPYVKALRSVLDNKKKIILANSCDGMRRLYDILSDQSYFLEVPRQSGEYESNYYYEQLLNLLYFLDINYDYNYKQKLIEAVKSYNHKRKLLNNLKDKLTARDFLQSIKIYTNTISGDLELMMEKANNKKNKECNPAVLLTSTCLLSEQIVTLITSNGFHLAGIDSCLGERSYNVRIDLNDRDCDPLKQLAKRYLQESICPRSMESKKRIAYINTYVSQKKIKGIIYFLPKFCDQAAYDFKLIKDWSRVNNIPILKLEGEYGIKDNGQLNTRIAAFRELLTL